MHRVGKTIAFIWMIILLVSCNRETITTPSPPIANRPTPTSTRMPTPRVTTDTSVELSEFQFPESIDPTQEYLFYLHGKIIEDQGIHAVSPQFGTYEYEAILNEFQNHNFVVISERRPKNTDSDQYARKIAAQITQLLKANVPPTRITVVGASKGSYIAAEVSNLLKNSELNFVLLGSCVPEVVTDWKQGQMVFYGNILAIYDSADDLAGSCQEIFSLSRGKGIARYNEIILHIGTGHGILYKPLEDWVLPAIEWATLSVKP